MINAVIFDLDGTLVQTEALKGLSYARAIMDLCPDSVTEADALAAFKDAVGLSRQEAAQKLIDRFDLAERAGVYMDELNVGTPWQAFVQIRLRHYENMIANPEMLQGVSCQYNLSLLDAARRHQLKTGLATMSHCPQAHRVLQILGIEDHFDFIATREDVENGKPDPEIYLMVAGQLHTAPAETLVIEDSTNGVQAAINAGMPVVAVANDLTRDSLYASGLLAERYIAAHRADLPDVVSQYIDLRG
ncbi:MAG: HAD family phosphatase [Chloroflexi bacterium]|nr:HAD family phosphatase [Chloroflexota bacterium]